MKTLEIHFTQSVGSAEHARRLLHTLRVECGAWGEQGSLPDMVYCNIRDQYTLDDIKESAKKHLTDLGKLHIVLTEESSLRDFVE